LSVASCADPAAASRGRFGLSFWEAGYFPNNAQLDQESITSGIFSGSRGCMVRQLWS